MTNNKQQTTMKLFTEKELRDFIDRNGCIVESDLDEKQLTPIELPSDEEIQKESLKSDFEFNLKIIGSGSQRDLIENVDFVEYHPFMGQEDLINQLEDRIKKELGNDLICNIHIDPL